MEQKRPDSIAAPAAEHGDLPEFSAQEAVIRSVATSATGLPDWFEERAFEYARWRHGVFEAICAGAINELKFEIANPEVLTSALEGEGGAIFVLSHTGCWFAVPFGIHELGVRFTFLMETASERLLRQYAGIDLYPIQPLPGATLMLSDGRRIRLPGSSTLQQVAEGLRRGQAVGMFGDTYRPGGQRAELLGLTVPLINHYALLSERLNRTLVVLHQWTEGEVIHMRFETVDPHTKPDVPAPELTRRTDRVRFRTRNYASLLDEDLRARPDQYAYFPNGVFGRAPEAPLK